jgi:thiol:disulfide interchange protein DsbC
MKQVSIIFLLLFAFGQCLANRISINDTNGAEGTTATADTNETRNLEQAKLEQSHIKKQVHAAFPDLVVETIKKSPVSGLYQLTSGPAVLYASNDGRYLVAGDVLDLAKVDDDRNVTESARRDARVSVLKKLDPKEMVIYRPKAVKAVVTVFTDADCGYCRKLHAEIPALIDLGVELRYLAYPRQGKGSATYTKMESIWCSTDRKNMMTKVMQGEHIQPLTCRNTIPEQLILGQKLGISGTPTLVFADGTVWGGYLSAEKLAKEAIKHRLKE